jgi:uncharacterized protein (TIGR02421 family)
MGAEVCAAAVAADTVLAEIAGSFDYLLYVSPNDSDEAWDRFSASSFREDPTFAYRRIDLDVVGLRERLERVRTADVADEAIARLLEGKRRELLHYLGLLTERGTPAFLERSIRLSGEVTDDLLAVAEDVLAWSRERMDSDDAAEPPVSPEAFAARAEDEIRRYRRQDPPLSASVHIRGDINALMVSGDRLFVPARRPFRADRVEALIHHEVGVHVLTWWNGHVQPLRILASGLGGYQEAQEGLGVLSELLCGGLTTHRLRELAARVIAARSVIDGASFLETFTDLHDERGFGAPRAFDLADRVHRGGGLVKDAGYLRGLVRLMAHLQAGGDLEPLLIGKPSLDDLDDIASLRAREILAEPRLHPHWLVGEGAQRLADLRAAPDVTTALLG